MSYNPFTLEGKTILVTGASSGLGQATAIACSRMGATLIITGRNAERLASTFAELTPNPGHRQILADLSTEEGINTLIAEMPRLDGVVLAAGVSLVLPVKYAAPDKMNWCFGTNFFAPAELSRLLFKKKLVNNGSSIVFIASISGVTKWGTSHSIYGASKAALYAWMKSCALEFSVRQIRVNSVSPGMIDTPMIHQGAVSEEQMKQNMEKYPLKRYGRTEEVANTCIFLLSNASSFITGTNIVVDGGLSI